MRRPPRIEQSCLKPPGPGSPDPGRPTPAPRPVAIPRVQGNASRSTRPLPALHRREERVKWTPLSRPRSADPYLNHARTYGVGVARHRLTNSSPHVKFLINMSNLHIILESTPTGR